MMIKMTLNGINYELKGETYLWQLADMIKDNHNSQIVAFKVNNHFKELRDKITESCNVEIVDMSALQGVMVYQRSLSYLFIRATKDVFGAVDVTIEHSLSNGLFCTIEKKPALAEVDIPKIAKRMRELVSLAEPFEKVSMKKLDAIKYFDSIGLNSKAELLRSFDAYDNDSEEEAVVNMYKYGNMIDYFYGYMLMNAGELREFELTYYKGGVVLGHPKKSSGGKVPAFSEQRQLSNVYRESERWSKILNINYIFNINKSIKDGFIREQILTNEALHEKKIAEIADSIHRANKRLILIAGPSSSGKTTFANRLRIQLRVNGLNPIALGTDDYYIDRGRLPLESDGAPDLETISALDLHKFNQDISDLLNGYEADIPIYDFKTGSREGTRKLKIADDQPIIIEGIHGLNPLLTQEISDNEKFKVYISCLTQLNLDEHNRIPTTDSRLIRRIVRGHKFRGSSALQTLSMWDSVRKGEDKFIFPFQERADEMFNSALVYELSVFKKYAVPLLEEITDSNKEYSLARYLLNLMSYVKDSYEEDIIPNTSIIKEFIGGNIFH